jgi:diadenosine tetraphosphate (Ap4A) HIT family hydrolase
MPLAQFKIHRQLLTDCHYLGRYRVCHLLLHKNAALPWFILVPETAVSDLLDMPGARRAWALREARHVAKLIKQDLRFPKVNFAAIGNIVPQLHLHIVGRKPGDRCWPAPVWGHLIASREYTATELRSMTDLVKRHSSFKPLLAGLPAERRQPTSAAISRRR